MKLSHSGGSYNIKFEPFAGSEHLVITDANVSKLYPELVGRSPILLPAGESSKNLEHYAFLASELVRRGCNRKSTIVALGGGVIGDLVGFVAATYMRGINFIQVPTTLLSQVDSSVGGKVGIDLPEGKNLVGAFYPPSEVVVDCRFLSTLPEREVQCGMAEVIKYGWIVDSDLLVTLRKGNPEFESIVKKCIEHKAKVVEEDEFETKGIRAWLNFGHTVGHAIEQITNYRTYTHGEAISIGMVVETKIAVKLGLAEEGLAEHVADSLCQYGLPIELKEKLSIEDQIKVMLRDKKSVNSEIAMSLVTEPGSCQLVSGISADVVKEVLSQ